jgi:hypothetical protein
MLKFTVSIPLDGVGGPPISWPVSSRIDSDWKSVGFT